MSGICCNFNPLFLPFYGSFVSSSISSSLSSLSLSSKYKQARERSGIYLTNFPTFSGERLENGGGAGGAHRDSITDHSRTERIRVKVWLNDELVKIEMSPLEIGYQIISKVVGFINLSF